MFGFFISVPDHFRLGWRAVSSRMWQLEVVTASGSRLTGRENNWKLQRLEDAPKSGGKTIGSCEWRRSTTRETTGSCSAWWTHQKVAGKQLEKLWTTREDNWKAQHLIEMEQQKSVGNGKNLWRLISTTLYMAGKQLWQLAGNSWKLTTVVHNIPADWSRN